MANVAPWAVIKGSLPPLIPNPADLAPPPALGAPPDMPASLNGPDTDPVGTIQKIAGTPKTPQVFAPSRQDRIESHLGNKLDQDYQKDADPFGSPDNHPGVFGKVLHAISHATGGDTRRGWEETGLEKRLNDLRAENSKNSLQDAEAGEAGARTGLTQEQTAELPTKTASEENLQGAEAGNLKSESAQRGQPDLAHAYAHAVTAAMNAGRDPSTDHVVQHLSDAITSIQRQPAPKGVEHVDLVGHNGKPIAATFDPSSGQYKDSTGKAISNPQPYEKPNQSGMVTVIAPDPNSPGGGVVQRVGAGAHLAPGSQTMAGFNSMNTPTTNQRTAAGRAENVLAMVPEVTGRIDAMKNDLGPVMGRWNDFMQGRVGSDNPQFAALRSDLLMMSSAVALAHAQGRLPENLREEFDRAINAPKQTPENLKATINAMVPWLQQVQSQGERQQPAGSAPKGGEIKINRDKDGRIIGIE